MLYINAIDTIVQIGTTKLMLYELYLGELIQVNGGLPS